MYGWHDDIKFSWRNFGFYISKISEPERFCPAVLWGIFLVVYKNNDIDRKCTDLYMEQMLSRPPHDTKLPEGA